MCRAIIPIPHHQACLKLSRAFTVETYPWCIVYDPIQTQQARTNMKDIIVGTISITHGYQIAGTYVHTHLIGGTNDCISWPALML